MVSAIMELEIINKLFLELSQVATAETEKELLYKQALEKIRRYPINEGNDDEQEMRATADEALRRAQLR
jgi:hypothetical protein